MMLHGVRLTAGVDASWRARRQRPSSRRQSHPPRASADGPLQKRAGAATQPAPSGDLEKLAKDALKKAEDARLEAQRAAELALQAAQDAQDAAERAQALLRQVSEKSASSTSGKDASGYSGFSFSGEFGSDSQGAYEERTRRLPKRIFLIRHGESEGNVDQTLYCRVPDPIIPLTEKGHQQAVAAGKSIKETLDKDPTPPKLFFYVSPYKRSKQTAAVIIKQFRADQIMGIREEPQLREQDFGNFQDAKTKALEKEERDLYSRFFYRFPNGESGADVYDRITMFEDHMARDAAPPFPLRRDAAVVAAADSGAAGAAGGGDVPTGPTPPAPQVRDIDKGRFPEGANIIIVTHGLTLRIFLARWFHWSVQEYEQVYNPPNSQPLVLLRRSMDEELEEVCYIDGTACDREQKFHVKDLYYLTKESMELLEGTNAEMCEMLIPEKAFERTLTPEELDDSCTWLDEDEVKRW